jgi:purine-nucleoside phosphorylase
MDMLMYPSDKRQTDRSNISIVSPKDALSVRLGKGYKQLIKQIPKYAIFSFFVHSAPYIHKRFSCEKDILWLGEYVKLNIFNYNNNPMVLVSLPFGSNIASMILEELIFCGVRYIISIGLACGISDKLCHYDLVVPNESYSNEGVAKLYNQTSSITASENLITIIENILNKNNINYKTGKSLTISTPYRETPNIIDLYKEKNAICIDMESASLFSIARYHKANIASIFAISDLIINNKWVPQFKSKKIKQAHEQLIQTALSSLNTISSQPQH